MNQSHPILQLKNITKTYKSGGNHQVVLQDVSYNFQRGIKTSILGSSGCGKTTLLNILGGIDTDFEGELLFNGVAISDFDKFRRENVSFIFQDLNLISHHNLIKNITLGLTNDVDNKHQKAMELLERVGLGQHAHKKPHQLSGGEKQRVAVARALARDCDILLCDEPTGSLDSSTKSDIIRLIMEIFQDKTIILITHDQKLADQHSDVILRIDNQKLTETRTCDAIPMSTPETAPPIDKAKSFRKRFHINLLSRKLSMFNASYLMIIISAIFLFGIGAVKGVEREIDQYLYTHYKVDKIDVYTMFSYNGLAVNVSDYNAEYDNGIHGFMTGLVGSTTFASSEEPQPLFINSLQSGLKNNIAPDIIHGRFPEQPHEILYSQGAARQKVYDYHRMSIDAEDAAGLFKLLKWVVELSPEALFTELSAIEFSYATPCVYNPNKGYDNDLVIVGLLDDATYYQDEATILENIGLPVRYDRYFRAMRPEINYKREMSMKHDGETIRFIANDNIYMLEEEFTQYLVKVFLSQKDHKFAYVNLFIRDADLALRDTVFDQFLLFKPLFRGNDHITSERETYYKDVYGYKVATIGACGLLALFALISIYNGIRTNIRHNRKNIGIYKSLGYTSDNIRSMFMMEGLLIVTYIAASTLVVWAIINGLLNEHIIVALDPNRILDFDRLIYLDGLSLLGIVSTVVLITLISIGQELKKMNIIHLIK